MSFPNLVQFDAFNFSIPFTLRMRVCCRPQASPRKHSHVDMANLSTINHCMGGSSSFRGKMEQAPGQGGTEPVPTNPLFMFMFGAIGGRGLTFTQILTCLYRLRANFEA